MHFVIFSLLAFAAIYLEVHATSEDQRSSIQVGNRFGCETVDIPALVMFWSKLILSSTRKIVMT